MKLCLQMTPNDPVSFRAKCTAFSLLLLSLTVMENVSAAGILQLDNRLKEWFAKSYIMNLWLMEELNLSFQVLL